MSRDKCKEIIRRPLRLDGRVSVACNSLSADIGRLQISGLALFTKSLRIPEMIETLQQGWKSTLTNLFGTVEDELTIASPFISANGVSFLIKALPVSFRKTGTLNFVSDLSPRNVGQGATDPHSFRTLFDSLPLVRLYHLPRLHAKVYVRDRKEAIVTSGNLTDGGIFRNFEYGLRVDDSASVNAIRQDLLDYAALGASIDQKCINEFCEASTELRALFLEKERSTSRGFETRLNKMLRLANDKLIASQLAGNSLHAILKKTIVYLLKKHGNLATSELHRLVKEIHPDLCDDSVDRVINGIHFGKKWKHSIRSAQSSLKRRGLASLSNGRWNLTLEPREEINYWFKPIGSADNPIDRNENFDDDTRIHFSKTVPRSVKPGDIIIAYAVGHKVLLSAYLVDSIPLRMTDRELIDEPRFERWPWFVEATNLSPDFGATWSKLGERYDVLVDEFRRLNPDSAITASGSYNLDALYWGKDKLRLSSSFADFLLKKVGANCI